MPLSSRRTARKNAFILLYQSDATGLPLNAVLDRWRRYRGEPDAYAEGLALGVEEEMRDLDELIGGVASGWPVHRMSAVDRNILRLALYEMLHVEDVPPEVAINEASELAKGYSGEEAPGFVGGVLRAARDEAGPGHLDEQPHEPRVGHG